MAEWLRRGLQILARRFDSGRGLQTSGLRARQASKNLPLSWRSGRFGRLSEGGRALRAGEKMTVDFQEMRVKMVDGQVRTTDVTDTPILNAMLEMPREEFVPAGLRPLAYMDDDIALGAGRFMMRPSPFARLVQLCGVRAGDLVLDVGCGSGYSSAILARIAGFVVALESEAELAAAAGKALAAVGCENVSVVEGPLPAGHAAQAPYDAIVVEGAVDAISPALIEQLKEGGRLVAVVGEGNTGRATLWLKEGGLVSSRPVFNAAVPMFEAFRREPVFRF